MDDITPTRAGPPPAESRPPLRAVIAIAFFFSGASALFYQVIWLRQLATVFGNTTLAISVTLTAFMSGLALGSYAFGRVGDRAARPFRIYAWLEILIGAYGLVSLSVLHGVHAGYLALASRLPYDSSWLVGYQFWASLLALVAPTALMGGTLPIASKGIVRRLDGIGPEVGRLYGINTLGAAVGVLLVGFVLLPVLGLWHAVVLAACLNLAVGAAVLAADAWRARAEARGSRDPRPAPAADAPSSPDGETEAHAPSDGDTPLRVILVLGLALSGFSGLALEVVWARAFSLYVGSSVYAFSAILLAVLIGIGLGSLLVARLSARREVDVTWFVAVQFGAGVGTFGLLFFYNSLAFVFLSIVMRFWRSFPTLLALEVLVIVGCLLLPALCSGAAFPIASRLFIQRSAVLSRSIGTLYAANTLGCIAGSFAAGFVLIPHIGLRATVMQCAACYMITAAAVLLVERGPNRAGGVVVLAGLAALVAWLPSWRQELMVAGFFRRQYDELATARAVMTARRDVLFYREGSLATVAVIRGRQNRSLVINAKVEASDVSVEMDTQTMLAHLPLLLADRTESVLVVGLGSGTTCGAAALHPTSTIECVEIEPAVAAGARYFSDTNRDVFADPRFRVVFADARNYLAAGRRRYDVIISEPSNPWFGGTASLFTVEHFQALRDSLADDGVICQWVQLYEMSPQDLRSVVATFVKVFPDATLWWVGRSHVDIALIAQKHPWKVDFDRFSERMGARPQIMPDFERAQLKQPVSVLAWLLLGPDDLRRMSTGSRLNTDNLPLLEFSAPRSLYRESSAEQNRTTCATYKAQPLSELVDLGPSAADADARAALAESFIEQHGADLEGAPYLSWMRDEYAAAAALAPGRADLREKLAEVEQRISERKRGR
ncbi:MAG: fused MFS/spermidine synthase [Armatimonadota bacterium]|nr:MAG: fused MFS/spermidine synthase [Armatimonadota bacterium]